MKQSTYYGPRRCVMLEEYAQYYFPTGVRFCVSGLLGSPPRSRSRFHRPLDQSMRHGLRGRLTCSPQLAFDSRMTSTDDSACVVLMQDACRSSGPRRCGVPLSDGGRLPCWVLMLCRTFARSSDGYVWGGAYLNLHRPRKVTCSEEWDDTRIRSGCLGVLRAWTTLCTCNDPHHVQCCRAYIQTQPTLSGAVAVPKTAGSP